MELCNAQDSSSQFEAQWRSAREHTKATERQLEQVAQINTVAQAKLAPKELRSRAFGAALLNARDMAADQSQLKQMCTGFLPPRGRSVPRISLRASLIKFEPNGCCSIQTIESTVIFLRLRRVRVEKIFVELSSKDETGPRGCLSLGPMTSLQLWLAASLVLGVMVGLPVEQAFFDLGTWRQLIDKLA